jgi:hypothetical protein
VRPLVGPVVDEKLGVQRFDYKVVRSPQRRTGIELCMGLTWISL